MKRTTLILVCLSLGLISDLAAYKIKEFKPKAPKEYGAFQDFQKILIGASAVTTPEAVEEIFDTKKMIEKEIMPVVVIIENHNDFAIRIDERDVYLVDKAGTQ